MTEIVATTFDYTSEERENLISLGMTNEDIDSDVENRNEFIKTGSDGHHTDVLSAALEETEDLMAAKKELIEVNDAILRLRDNKDFQALEEAYYVEEKDRLADQLTSASFFKSDITKEMHDGLAAIGFFKKFLSTRAMLAKDHVGEMPKLVADQRMYAIILANRAGA